MQFRKQNEHIFYVMLLERTVAQIIQQKWVKSDSFAFHKLFIIVFNAPHGAGKQTQNAKRWHHTRISYYGNALGSTRRTKVWGPWGSISVSAHFASTFPSPSFGFRPRKSRRQTQMRWLIMAQCLQTNIAQTSSETVREWFVEQNKTLQGLRPLSRTCTTTSREGWA